jgi:hypothetical protein
MSYVLDDSGRVVRSSLWVLRELAGADTAGVPLLWRRGEPGAKR